jgi:hypothetical protein
MIVLKCDSCGKEVNPSKGYYRIADVKRVDATRGWTGRIPVDICDACWESLMLHQLEVFIRGRRVEKNEAPPLNERKGKD